MGYSEQQFRCTTPRFFYSAAQGFLEQETAREQARWEQARLTAFYAAAPHVKGLKPSDVLAFTWERERRKAETPRLVPEKLAQQRVEFDELARSIWAAKPQ